MANSDDPDEMQHDAVFHLGHHCLRRLKGPTGTEIHHDLEKSSCDPLTCTIDSPIINVLICTGKSIRIQEQHLQLLSAAKVW